MGPNRALATCSGGAPPFLTTFPPSPAIFILTPGSVSSSTCLPVWDSAHALTPYPQASSPGERAENRRNRSAWATTNRTAWRRAPGIHSLPPATLCPTVQRRLCRQAWPTSSQLRCPYTLYLPQLTLPLPPKTRPHHNVALLSSLIANCLGQACEVESLARRCIIEGPLARGVSGLRFAWRGSGRTWRA